MKNLHYLLLFVTLFSFSIGLRANNLKVTDVSLAMSGEEVSFKISWDNSWYINENLNVYPKNWDAVWVFIKTQDCNDDREWKHAKVATTGHSVNNPLKADVSADQMGVFIRRTAYGSGNIPTTDVTLKLDGSYDKDFVNIDVMGIEMVAVLEGDFYIGGGSASLDGGTSGNTSSQNYRFRRLHKIENENAIAAGAIRTDGCTASTSYPCHHPAIPAEFPKGFNKFYMMKYEITQGQYVHFLNLLNYAQQDARTAVSPNSVAGTSALAATPVRNGIKIKTPGNSETPAVYACDLNGNEVYDESSDGENIACNYLNWKDVLAYMDWTALRPMTELEFEKACRGPFQGLDGEYAWGNDAITSANANTLYNAGQPNEISATSIVSGSGLAAVAYTGSNSGPMRAGFAATSTSNRISSGAGYWGAMDLTGNVGEQTYSVGYRGANASGFEGTLGNGELSIAGEADATSWSSNVAHSIVRGGSFAETTLYGRVYDRAYVESTANNVRNEKFGGRGVRQF